MTNLPCLIEQTAQSTKDHTKSVIMLTVYWHSVNTTAHKTIVNDGIISLTIHGKTFSRCNISKPPSDENINSQL